MLKRIIPFILAGMVWSVYTLCCSPYATWACQDIDCFDFLYSTSTFNVLHAPGAPLYVILGWLVTRLPGNDVWNLSFCLSVIPTLITSVLIYYIVYKKTLSSFASFTSVIVFTGSQIILSQAIIPEIYSLQCMFIVLTYILFETNRPKLALVALGLAMCMSWGAAILLPLFIWRYWSIVKPLKYASLVGTLPLLSYLYIPLANRPPHLSMGPNGFYEFIGYITYHPSAVLNLPIWELPQRFGEFIALLLGCIGLATIVLLVALRKQKCRTLFILCIPGVIFYLTTRGPDAFVQLVPPIALSCIAIGYIVPYIKAKVVIAICIVSMTLLGLNAYNYDIGRTLDPYPTAAEQVLQQLDQVPDSSWVVAVHDPAYAGIYYYNLVRNKDLKGIHPLFTDPNNAQWWEVDRAEGIVFPEIPYNGDYDPQDVSTWSVGAMQIVDIANENESFWLITYVGNRSRLEAEVVYITEDTLPPQVSGELSTEWWEYITVYPYVYKYVSGEYMMNTAWRTGTSTNLTCGLFGMLLAFGAILGYYVPKKILNKLPSKQRSLATICVTATATMIFCYVLSLAGVPGFRW